MIEHSAICLTTRLLSGDPDCPACGDTAKASRSAMLHAHANFVSGVLPGGHVDGPHDWAAYGLTGWSWAIWPKGRDAGTAHCRYTLGRTWDGTKRRLVFVGLNPSTANAHAEDPTIRKLVRYANRWGLGGLDMLNLFAYRSTDPDGLPSNFFDAVGNGNDTAILNTFAIAKQRGDTLALGWGVNADKGDDRRGRAAWMVERAHVIHGRPMAFGFTNSGQPKHPLYLKNEATLIEVPR